MPASSEGPRDSYSPPSMKEVYPMEVLIVFAIICGVIGAVIADDKVMGAVLGALLGPIGLVIVAVMKGKQ